MNMDRKKVFIFAILFGIIYGFSISDNSQSSDIFEIINRLEFVEYDFDKIYVHLFLRWYFHIITFQILFGTYIYKHFCTASVYYFSRMNNRIIWFIRENIKLCLICFMYISIITGICCMAGGAFNNFRFDKNVLFILCYHLCIQSLWLFATTIMINVLSILFGSSISFSIIYSVQMTFLLCNSIFSSYFQFERGNVERKTNILKLNPISHLVLKWHNSRLQKINSEINFLNIDFKLSESIVFFIIISIIVFISGCIIVKRQELIYINRETGGAE